MLVQQWLGYDPGEVRARLAGCLFAARRFHVSYDAAFLCPLNPVVENTTYTQHIDIRIHSNEYRDLAYNVAAISAIKTIHTHTQTQIVRCRLRCLNYSPSKLGSFEHSEARNTRDEIAMLASFLRMTMVLENHSNRLDNI